MTPERPKPRIGGPLASAPPARPAEKGAWVPVAAAAVVTFLLAVAINELPPVASGVFAVLSILAAVLAHRAARGAGEGKGARLFLKSFAVFAFLLVGVGAIVTAIVSALTHVDTAWR